MTAATTTPVELCVGVIALQPSSERGQTAAWAVGAWTTGGNVPDAKLQLTANPASGGTPRFTFGCGSGNGTSTCDLGAMAANAAQREVEAQVAVPLTATTVTSISLVATGTAANLRTDPAASASVTIVAPTTPIGVASTSATGGLPVVGSPDVSSSLNPGGSASGLFPTLAPQTPDPTAQGTARKTGAAQVADNSPLSEGSNTLGAQVAGLAALALAGVFALTRISIRRPAPSPPAEKVAGGNPPPKAGNATAKGAEGASATAESEAAEDPPADPEA